MLTFHHVSFDYQGTTGTLIDVSFSIPPGSCTLLVGHNGAGKSTIVQLSNGLLRPRSGEIRLRGYSIAELPVHEIVRDVAVMFQHPGDQLTERTVEREVAVGVQALRLDRGFERVRAALDLVELSRSAHIHPYDLDPSDRKLVTLASVLALRTPVVVLDEPFVGLGPTQVRTVERVMIQLRDEGRSVLLVAHDVTQAWGLVDRVVVLDRGTAIVEVNARDGVLTDGVLEAAGMTGSHARRFGRALGGESAERKR